MHPDAPALKRPHAPVFWAGGLAILAAAAALWWFGYQTYFQGLASSDGIHYAEVGRNVAQGRGLIQRILYPGLWSYFPSRESQPFFVHAPLLPVLLSLAFKVFGTSDAAAVIPSAASFVACAVLVFWLGMWVFKSARIGFLGAVFTLASWHVLAFSLTSMTELPHAFLLLAVAALAWHAKSLWQELALGLLLGVGFLMRQNTLLFLPAVLLYRVFGEEGEGPRRRLLRAALFLLGWIIAASPEWIRTLETFGTFQNPLFRLYFLIDTKAPVMWAYFDPDHPSRLLKPAAYFLDHPGELFHKWANYLRVTLAVILPTLVSPFVRHWPIGGIFGQWRDRRVRWWKGMVFGMIAAQILAAPLTFTAVQYFVIFLPFMGLFAGETICHVIEHSKRRPRIARAMITGLVVAYFGLPYAANLGFFLSETKPLPLGDYHFTKSQKERLVGLVEAHTAPGELVVTGPASLVTWLTGRPTMLYTALAPPDDGALWKKLQDLYGFRHILFVGVPDAAAPAGFVLKGRLEEPGFQAILYSRPKASPARLAEAR